MSFKKDVHSWLANALEDPLTQILAQKSHLTHIQLETLLIDILAEKIAGQSLKYDEKARLRLKRAKISRGSFNRTLRQAKTNAVKAIYTVILLGYLGFLQDTTLSPYLEIANKLDALMKAYQSIPTQSGQPDDHLNAIEVVKEGLENSLKQLSEM